VQVTDRFLGNFGRHRGLASAFEDACGTFKQRPLPLMDTPFSAASSDWTCPGKVESTN
jgi:hypothetical protein